MGAIEGCFPIHQRPLESLPAQTIDMAQGQWGEQGAIGGAERDWKREIGVEGARYGGRWCWMDGATSGTCCDSKRVEMRSLAGEQTGQHGR